MPWGYLFRPRSRISLITLDTILGKLSEGHINFTINWLFMKCEEDQEEQEEEEEDFDFHWRAISVSRNRRELTPVLFVFPNEDTACL